MPTLSQVMSMNIFTHNFTIDEFMRLSDDEFGKLREMVGDKIYDPPSYGMLGATISSNLAREFFLYYREHKQGEIAFNGLHIVFDRNKPIVRVPDLSYFTERWPRPLTDDPAYTIPAFVAEIVAPYTEENLTFIAEKVADYQRTGVRLIWLIDPCRKAVTVLHDGVKPEKIGINGVLDGKDVIPDLRIAVSAIFEYK